MNNIHYYPEGKKFFLENYIFDLEKLEAKFYYSFDKEIHFEEKISFDDPNFDLRQNLDFEVLDNLLFHLHIALGISYYKAYPTSILIIESGFLDSFQMKFWKKFYLNGLGEFLYTNNISPEKLFNFEAHSDKKLQKTYFPVSNRALVAIGGGKDSLVSIELLQKSGIDFDTFVFGKTDSIKEGCIEVLGKKNLLVTRKLSEKLFEINKIGYLNGHVPITGIIAFVMETVAYLYDYKYLVLSNERSANYGNTQWKGVNINHQYSKSLEFEQDFSEYVKEYISGDMKYFSILRGMYEFKIAELFVKYGKKYFHVFSSCNNNFKILKTGSTQVGNKNGIWCNNCPKCAFVFCMIRPFISQQEVIDIFGEDLYEKKQLEQLFRELLGISGIKPFECVGTNEEVILAMKKTIEYSCYSELPYILKIFLEDVDTKMIKNDFIKIENKLLKIYDDDIIPDEIKNKINFNK